MCCNTSFAHQLVGIWIINAFLAIMNDSLDVFVSLSVDVLYSQFPWSCIAKSQGDLVLKFWSKKELLDFKMATSRRIPSSHVQVFQFPHILVNANYCLSFLIMSVLRGAKLNLTMSLFDLHFFDGWMSSYVSCARGCSYILFLED